MSATPSSVRSKEFPKQLQLPAFEEEILAFWEETKAFEVSIERRSTSKPYNFYDGPPFATGLPHYGHLLASTIKDVIPRYKTMQGFKVERVWGWDCHGIPIENMIENELELKGGRKGIEALGIDKFNQACRASILKFDKEWQQMISRLGRWVDFKHSYKTMDRGFMESVWWGFAQMYQKELVYQGRKVILYCPRCETPLSNFEIAMDNSYKDVTEPTAIVSFRLKNSQDLDSSTPTSLLAWTTTPWTLLGNVAVAVSPTTQYVCVQTEKKRFWLAEERVSAVFSKDLKELTIVDRKQGSELVGLEYEPLYRFEDYDTPVYQVLAGEFVTTEEGTGLVHISPVYGEDDYALVKKHEFPVPDVLDEQGKFLPIFEPIAGQFYKKGNQWILEDLESRGLLFSSPDHTHSYPYCYRCSTPLYYNAVPAWFIDVQKIKSRLIEENEKIAWYPNFLKHGRFLHGLENAPDWNISRSRFWGTPMPIWVSSTGKRRVISSIQELRDWAVNPELVGDLADIHREFIDDLEIWVDDEKTEKGRRIPEVFDCWVESGSMPFAALHYPFENKESFEQSYPADFISEYIAQTRAWFYTLHVISVGLFDQPSFLNVVATGTILAEDGTKMSKSKKNFPDPKLLISKYGVDPIRLYLMSSPVMRADNFNFSEQQVAEIRNKVFGVLWNTVAFFKMYKETPFESSPLVVSEQMHVLDRWLVSRISTLVAKVTTSMDQYDVVTAARALVGFVSELSTWYLRLSRDRLRTPNSPSLQVFGEALKILAQLFAPITPFVSEMIYQQLMGLDAGSVHHTDWPSGWDSFQDLELEKNMSLIRRLVEQGHAIRKAESLRVRQPLASASITASQTLSDELLKIFRQEVNIEQTTLEVKQDAQPSLEIDTKLTPELLEKGEMRDVIRQIQDLRKDAKVPFDALVVVEISSWPERYEEEIKSKTLTKELIRGSTPRIVE